MRKIKTVSKGDRFGKLVVIEIISNQIIKCLCDCGVYKNINKSNLICNKSKSCGKGICQSNFKDIANQKFGFIMAIEYIGSDTSHGALWKCLCDCGNSCNVRANSLRNGRTKSCGCKKSELASEKNSKDFGVSNLRQLYNTYKNNAKLREYFFDLDIESFEKIIKEKCYYCGIDPYQKITVQNIKGDRTIIYNGIDRLDNTIGYTLNNVVASCGICNIAKRDMSLLFFIDWVKRVNNHLSERKILNYGE